MFLIFQVILKAPWLRVLLLTQCGLDNSVRLMGANQVDISLNSYERLTPKIFFDSSVIAKLRINHNRLRKVDCLRNMTNLKMLHLSSNRITALPDGIFNISMQIEELELSHNHIVSIEGLKVLNNLRTLDLRFNRIHSFPKRVFQKLENLETLVIDHNLISFLDDMPNNLFLTSFVCRMNNINNVNFFQPVVKQVHYVLNLDSNPMQQINVSNINVIHLSLQNCSIHTIQALNKMEYLRYIMLHDNLIRRIPENTIFDLPHVYSIDFRYNLIEHFPRMYLPSLNFLSLDYNKIRNITEDCLNALPNLRYLAVGYNLLVNLPELYHENLEELDLRGNGIQHLASLIAKNFPKLIFFYLSDNRITSLGDIKGALAIPWLYLSDNVIASIWRNEPFYQINSLQLQLSNNLISIVNFSVPLNIKSVFLDNNCIENVLLGALHSQIESLDMCENRLSSLSFLNSFPNLVSLDLSVNRITHVEKENFRANLALQSINLSQNNIRSVEEHSFFRLTNLFRIDLSNNNLFSLGESTFPHKSLISLNLQSNNLVNISNIFTGVPTKLENLALAANAFTHSLNTILNMSRSVMFLDMIKLSRNAGTVSSSLRNIEFTRLTYLYLSSVNFSEFSYPINAPLLTMLGLNFNKLEVFPSYFLRMTLDIDHLSLEGNNIRCVRYEDIKNMRKLYHLNLGRNCIDSIERGAFWYLEKLRYLDLSNNNIIQLGYEALFPIVFNENGLVLRGNPWDCTCELRWLQFEIEWTDTAVGLRCASPLYMSNKKITEKELECRPVTCEGMPTNIVIRVLAGDVVRILCPVVLDNVDTIEWLLTINSSVSSISNSSIDTDIVVGASAREITSITYSVTSERSHIQCTAENGAGTTTVDFRLVVCGSLDADKCMENGSSTIEEWNDEVNRMCHPSTSSSSSSTSSSDMPEISRSQGKIISSKPVIFIIATITALTEYVELLNFGIQVI